MAEKAKEILAEAEKRGIELEPLPSEYHSKTP